MSQNQDNQDRLAQLRADLERIQTTARQMCEGRQAVDMSAEEINQLEEMDSQADYLRQQIQARERIDRLAQLQAGNQTGGQSQAQAGQRRTAPTGTGAQFTDRRAGFSNLGDFAQAVCRSLSPGASMDQRLAQMAPTTYSNEGTGADGGYLIPPEFSSRVMEYVSDESSLYARVDKWPVNHQLNYPVDEESPWSTSGPQAYWEGEADQGTQSKVKLRTAGMSLNKLMCLCPVTDELMADAAQLSAYLTSVIAKKMRWKVDYAILRGTGAGQPLGILNAPCLKTTARNTASHVYSQDVFALYSGIYGDFRSNAVWIYNQDVETELWGLVVAGSSSDVPVYLPAGTPYSNLANAPNGTLYGRPLVPHQACSTMGTEGDVIAADLSQYIIGYKSLGPNFSTSLHLWFDYDVTAVKAVWRICGMPKWSTTIAAKNGSATYSAFHTLTDAS